MSKYISISCQENKPIIMEGLTVKNQIKYNLETKQEVLLINCKKDTVITIKSAATL